jgi:hypothetical protein
MRTLAKFNALIESHPFTIIAVLLFSVWIGVLLAIISGG